MKNLDKSYRPLDIALASGCSQSTVKRCAKRIGVEGRKTPAGQHRWDQESAVKIVEALRERNNGARDLLAIAK